MRQRHCLHTYVLTCGTRFLPAEHLQDTRPSCSSVSQDGGGQDASDAPVAILPFLYAGSGHEAANVTGGKGETTTASTRITSQRLTDTQMWQGCSSAARVSQRKANRDQVQSECGAVNS